MRSRPTDSASMRARSDATWRSARAFGGQQFGDPFVGQPQRGDGAVVVVVETDLALVELTDLALHRLELGLGLLRPGRGFLDAVGEPGHPLVDRLDPGPHGLHLTGQPGQAFPAVGLGAHRGQVGPLGLGGDAFGLTQVGAGGVEPGPGIGQFGEQLALLLGDLLGLGVQLVGVRAARGETSAGSASSSWARSLAIRTVALTRSASADSRNQVCWACSARSDSVADRGLVRGQLVGGHRQRARRPRRAPCAARPRCRPRRRTRPAGSPGRRRPAAAGHRAGRPGWSARGGPSRPGGPAV